MSLELAFCLINPYTIAKSRTGGVIGRIMTRTGLELVAARMFGPSEELVRRYADLVRRAPDVSPQERDLLADYVLRAYMPEPGTDRRRRVMMLLFEGEDAIAKVRMQRVPCVPMPTLVRPCATHTATSLSTKVAA